MYEDRVASFFGYGGRWLAEMEDRLMWSGVSKKREAKIRRTIEAELKDRLVEELTPVIRKQVEDEIRDEAVQEARRSLAEEARKAVPSPREREAFQAFVREVELDAHAQATVASTEADKAETTLRLSRRWRNSFAYILLLTLLPAAFLAYQAFGLSLAMGAVVVTMALTLLVLAASNSNRHEGLQKRFNTKRKVSSDYLLIAERAKALRLVQAERLDTKKSLDQLAEDLQSKKAQLDRDHWPRVDDLYNARDSIRTRISIEEEKVRVFDDFDERLEEAQADAEVAAKSQA